MLRILLVLMLAAIGPLTFADDAKPDPKPQVQVCFVLDTTSSMSGLIDGAKAKIWAVANQVVKQKPTPDVKFALIGFRDRGDAYVTKRFDLTDDLDAVFKNLSAFRAEGGGDEPESVNQALDEAVNNIAWSPDRAVLKIIFLVGDAPPHMDYAGEKQYPEICKEAAKKDLIINTIQCGNIASTTPIWQAIAKSSEGEYAAIAQDGNVTVVAAPQDAEIARLSAQLAQTMVAYAPAGAHYEDAAKAIDVQRAYAASAPASTAADRAGYLLTAATTRPVVLGTLASNETKFYAGVRVSTVHTELIDELASGAVKLADLKDEQLPPEMRKMTPTERETFVAARQKERAAIQAKIAELTKARTDYLDAERKKAAAKPDAFDEQVAQMIDKQAAARRK